MGGRISTGLARIQTFLWAGANVPLTLIVFIEISFVSGNCMSEFMGLIYGSYEAKVDMSCLSTFRRKVVSEDIFGSVGLK